jgi:hypothetical protein
MQLLGLLWSLFISFADILLWPEQAVRRHLQEVRRNTEPRREPRTIWDVCHRVFILLTIIGLCLLLLWP